MCLQKTACVFVGNYVIIKVCFYLTAVCVRDIEVRAKRQSELVACPHEHPGKLSVQPSRDRHTETGRKRRKVSEGGRY